jgi:hypothetical protein
MGPDHDVVLLRHRQGTLHHQRIAAMEPAGDIGLVDMRHDFVVTSHFPGAVALTEVAIEH